MPGERITRAKRTATALAIAGLLLSVAVPAGAQSYREREQQLEELIRAKQSRLHSLNSQASSISDQIAASDQRLAGIQRKLDALSAKLADARAVLAKIEARLDTVSAALHAKTAQLEATLGELAARQTIMNARVANIYMNAPTAYSEAMSAAQDFADIVAANEFAGSVVRADQDAVAKLEETKLELEVQRNNISEAQAELATQRNAAAAQAHTVAALVTEQASVRDEQATERANQRYLLSQINHQRQQYINAIKALQAESEAIGALLRGFQAGQNVVQGRGGYLKWPVSGPITSPFGWRTHPIYHYRSFHTGIDIGVASGTIVKAARYGKVVYTGYQGAYGLIVMIDHGGQLATIYAHLSRVFVRAGQRVGTLQSIAASGNTGWSTGPHLHFEVRSQGQPVNPVRWL